MKRAAVLAIAVMLATTVGLPLNALARQHRSSVAKRDFQRANPCPANQHRRGTCHGYVIDHIIPLCAGGPDRPSNMQWQSVRAAKIKDKKEWKLCRELKRRHGIDENVLSRGGVN